MVCLIIKAALSFSHFYKDILYEIIYSFIFTNLFVNVVQPLISLQLIQSIRYVKLFFFLGHKMSFFLKIYQQRERGYSHQQFFHVSIVTRPSDGLEKRFNGYKQASCIVKFTQSP